MPRASTKSPNYKIMISDRPPKKYMALVKQPDGRNPKKVYFGDSRYQQYKDSTGLGYWSHLDHNDEKRRSAYMRRHGPPDRMYTPGWFSWNFLW